IARRVRPVNGYAQDMTAACEVPRCIGAASSRAPPLVAELSSCPRPTACVWGEWMGTAVEVVRASSGAFIKGGEDAHRARLLLRSLSPGPQERMPLAGNATRAATAETLRAPALSGGAGRPHGHESRTAAGRLARHHGQPRG